MIALHTRLRRSAQYVAHRRRVPPSARRTRSSCRSSLCSTYSNGVRAMAYERCRTSDAAVLLAAVSAVLGHYSGHDEIVLQVNVANRIIQFEVQFRSNQASPQAWACKLVTMSLSPSPSTSYANIWAPP